MCHMRRSRLWWWIVCSSMLCKRRSCSSRRTCLFKRVRREREGGVSHEFDRDRRTLGCDYDSSGRSGSSRGSGRSSGSKPGAARGAAVCDQRRQNSLPHNLPIGHGMQYGAPARSAYLPGRHDEHVSMSAEVSIPRPQAADGGSRWSGGGLWRMSQNLMI